jgi:PAS domain-containing protein
MPAMIWSADPSGRIDRWNRTMIETIGKPWDTSETFDLISKIDSAQAREVEQRWAKSVRLGIPYEDTHRILGNDGSQVAVIRDWNQRYCPSFPIKRWT